MLHSSTGTLMKVHPVYLNGQFVLTDGTIPVVDPATGATFASMSVIEREKAATVVRDAHAAFQFWRETPASTRADFLERIAAEIRKRLSEFSKLISLENGKPVVQSEAEVAAALDILVWFAGEARRNYGRVLPVVSENRSHLVVKYPVGVVAAFTPWNFPLSHPVRKIAAALAAGCTVILKPSRRTPLTAVLFAECLAECELPKGVFQLVCGDPGALAKEFLSHPHCRKLSFTGSTAVGRELIRAAADQVKLLSLQLSGNAPAIVFDDCDLDGAVNGVMIAKFLNSGQSCIAVNRIYVQRNLYPGFLQMLVQRVKELKIGDGLDSSAQVGPMISEAAVARVREHVSDAVQGGAKLLQGGRRVNRPGFFFEPTVLGDVSRASLCMYEEVSGPVAAVTPFDTESEVIELANNSEYGFGACVFTSDLKRAHRVAHQLDCGVVGLNDGQPGTSSSPVGGVKQSGWGRELGSEGMEAFLHTKLISIGM
jgi:succinate-semialdehyde dehydrogenase/glutarate-semialdehyde dehydrogenase